MHGNHDNEVYSLVAVILYCTFVYYVIKYNDKVNYIYYKHMVGIN